jgi:quercetin dioxygenase-like cupin family protein
MSAALDLPTPAPIIRAAADGARRWFYGGGVHLWKATEAETGGAFLLFEDALEQGKRTPLHTHPQADETMYMLEGEILVHVDGEEHVVSAGGLVMAPRGVPHAFLVTSPQARMLCLHTPGGAQAFYWGASEPITDDDAGSGVVDFGRIQESAARNGGIEIVGPPPFA